MATETLHATALTSGAVATSTNALGAPNGTWTTDVDQVSWTARFALGNPVGNQANGTHTITLRVRKETGTGTPSVTSVDLYVAGALLGNIKGGVLVTSTTGQDIACTFADTLIDGIDLSTLEVQITTLGVGGSGSARTCVQLDGITWSGDFTTVSAPNQGGATGAIGWVGVATGARESAGGSTGAMARTGAATGASVREGSASGTVARSGVATGATPGVSPNEGGAVGSIVRSGVATGARAAAASAAGTITWVGVVTGMTLMQGAAFGTLTHAGSATGKRDPIGAASGAVSRIGSATGAKPLGGGGHLHPHARAKGAIGGDRKTYSGRIG